MVKGQDFELIFVFPAHLWHWLSISSTDHNKQIGCTALRLVDCMESQYWGAPEKNLNGLLEHESSENMA